MSMNDVTSTHSGLSRTTLGTPSGSRAKAAVAPLNDDDVSRPGFYVSSGGKRLFDIVVSSAILLFLLPILIIITVAVAVQGGFPVLFRHRRIGRDEVPFGCLKFRSMVRDADVQLARLLETSPASRKEWQETQKLRVDPRVHAVGNLLRKSSLDELPQLFNVLRGEMSLVGPRPIVAAEVVRYGAKFRHYTSVRPGLTGLWQISGRSDVGYGQRVSLDAEYVRSIGFWSDMRILFKTGWVVLVGRGSY